VLFLKPLKMADALHVHWLSVDRSRHEIKGALGIIRQDRGTRIKAIRATHPASLYRVNELAAFLFLAPAAFIVDAITGPKSHHGPRK
jgi:hypothetical protein